MHSAAGSPTPDLLPPPPRDLGDLLFQARLFWGRGAEETFSLTGVGDALAHPGLPRLPAWASW